MESRTKQEQISVIIPVYNVAPYLDQCLESVCGQTYRNLEILLIDDGSTDESGAICDMWAEKDARIRVIHKENGGVSSARNEGLKAATGTLIGFVDSDDWIEPEMYEKLARSIITGHTDAAMCGYVDYPYRTEDKPVNKGIKSYPACGFADAVIHIYERNGYFTSICNKLFRRSLIYRNGLPILLDQDIAVGEDELWLFTVLQKMRKASFVPEALYYYRARAGSVTKFATVTLKQMSVLHAKKKVLKIIPQTADVQALARSVFYNDCFLMLVKAYCTKDTEKMRIILRELAPHRIYWLKTHDAPFMRKLKVMLLEFEMRFCFPVCIVQFTNDIKRNRLQ